MNSLFINITKGLEIKEDNYINANTLEDVLDTFNFHHSIERIRRTVTTNVLVREITLNQDGTKATPVGDIPSEMLKSKVDMHFPFLTKIINYSFENGSFPYELKLAEISPIFKKNNDLDKQNYRSVSILSHV